MMNGKQHQKTRAAFAASLFLLASLPSAAALAQDGNVIDMATLKCSDLLGASAGDALVMLTWMRGYYGGMAHDTKWDMSKLNENVGKLGDFCRAHQDTTLMNAIETAVIQRGG